MATKLVPIVLQYNREHTDLNDINSLATRAPLALDDPTYHRHRHTMHHTLNLLISLDIGVGTRSLVLGPRVPARSTSIVIV